MALRLSSSTSVGGLMENETLRSIFSAGDETIAALDRLHMTTQASRIRARASLDAVVAGLTGTFVVEEPDPLERRERAETDRRPPSQDPQPFVALPQRSTHGGPFGPKIRDKLTQAALAKKGW